MPANYVLLATQTVGNGGAASVTFANIPQSGYTDLKIVLSARSTANGGQNVNLTFNSTASGYSDKILSGNGATVSSFSSGNTTRGGSCAIPGADFTANIFGNGEIYIPNYRSSSAKLFASDSVTENNATTAYNQIEATAWSGTAAITSILIDLSGGNFAAGSTFYLYGLAAVGTTPALAPFASGGDVIANDGTYWYHAFKTTGTFVPNKALTCDYLVVAGGGGGGGSASGNAGAGGGGAGGYRSGTGFAVTATSYAITVGAGGVGNNRVTKPTKGSDSVFSSITSTGGGLGSSAGNGPAGSGGSGGGGTADFLTGGAGNTPSTSPAQGYNGGTTISASPYCGAGGGGATAAGGVGQTSGNGAGGAGSNALSSWATATATGASGYYAGGGGGGGSNSGSGASAGGAGGGGAGSNSGVGTAGTPNTGGGGGGVGGGSSPDQNGYAGGNGGSGIIIIRYAMV